MMAEKSELLSALPEPAHSACRSSFCMSATLLIRRLRADDRDLVLARHPRQEDLLAHVVVDAGEPVELRGDEPLAAGQQQGEAVGRRVDGAVHGDHAAGRRLVGRDQLGADPLLQERAHRAGIGVVAAARAAHGEQAALLALVERGVGMRRRRGDGNGASGRESGEHALRFNDGHLTPPHGRQPVLSGLWLCCRPGLCDRETLRRYAGFGSASARLRTCGPPVLRMSWRVT